MTIEEYIASLNLADDARKKATEGLKNFLKDSYVEKTKFDEATTAKSNLETQIKERDKQLKDLKATAGNKEEFENKIKELQEANKTAREKYEVDLKNLRVDSAIKLKITGIAQDVDIVAGLLDRNKLIVSDDAITGLDEQLKVLKESKPFLFKAEDTLKSQPYKPNNGHNPTNNPFSKEYFNLTACGKLMKENPEQAKALAEAAGNTMFFGGTN